MRTTPTNSTPDRIGRIDWVIALAISVLALLARLRFLLTSPDRGWPHSAWFQGDATLWPDWAAALAQGQEFEHGIAIHSPAAAYLLHWMGYGAGANNFVAAKVVWCVVSALACGATYLAARMEVGRRAAGIAGALVAFSFSQYLLATSLNVEAVYTLLLPPLVIGTIRLGRRPSFVTAGAVGVLHGLATIVRAEHTLLLLMMLGWSAWQMRGSVRRPMAALRNGGILAMVVVLSVATCLPWTITSARGTQRFNTVAEATDYSKAFPPFTEDGRQLFESLPAFARHDNFQYLCYVAQRKGVPQVTAQTIRDYFAQEFGYFPEPVKAWNLVSSQGPLCFALGNHPKATGGFSKAGLDSRFDPDPSLNFGLPSHLYLYNHGYEAGLKSIRENPARWRWLVGQKLLRFVDGATQGMTALNLPIGRDGVRNAVDMFTARSGAVVWWRCVLGVLFVGGLVCAVRRRVGALWVVVILSKVVTTVAFYGYARQGASILPAFAFFAALGVDGVMGLVARAVPERARRRVGIGVCVVVIAGVVVAEIWAGSVTAAPVAGSRKWAAPKWGENAFESFFDLDVRVRPVAGP